MALGYNIVVDKLSCWQAFEPKRMAPFNPSAESDEAERASKNVAITPDPKKKSQYRKIKFKFTLPLFVSDVGIVDEILQIIGALLDTAKSVLPGAMAASSSTALPTAVDFYVKLITLKQQVEGILANKTDSAPITLANLPLRFEPPASGANGDMVGPQQEPWYGLLLTLDSPLWTASRLDAGNRGEIKILDFVQGAEERVPVPLPFESDPAELAGAYESRLVAVQRELTIDRLQQDIRANITTSVAADNGQFSNVVSGLTLQALVGTRSEVRRFLIRSEPEQGASKVGSLLDALGAEGALAFAAEELPLRSGERVVLDRIAAAESADVGAELATLSAGSLANVAIALGREDAADALLDVRDGLAGLLATRMESLLPAAGVDGSLDERLGAALDTAALAARRVRQES